MSAVLLTALAILIGSRVSIAASGPQFTGTISGVVTVVNASGTRVCMRPTGQRDDACSDLLTLSGATRNVGDYITVWVVSFPISSSVQVERFILEPPPAGRGTTS